MRKLLLVLVIALSSCGFVYKGSIEGIVEDFEESNNSSVSDAGINKVVVYLYTDEKLRDADYDVWVSQGLTPEKILDKKNKPVKNYYDYTETNGTSPKGKFSFNGIIWQKAASQYGKSGDRLQVFFNLFHKDYGLIKNSDLYEITSNVTSTLPSFKITKSLPEVVLTGRVVDMNKKSGGDYLPLVGVSVNIFMPKTWTFSGDDVTVTDWEKTPKYTLSTDSKGYFEQKISYIQLNGEDKQNCKVAIVCSLANYSLWTLNANDNEIFSGYTSTGTKTTSTTKISDLEKTPSYWQLFDGEVQNISFWDESKTTSATYSQEIGLAVPFMKKDYDLDANGINDIYTEVNIPFDKNKRTNFAKLISPIRARQISMTASVSGQVKDNTGVGKNDITVNFYKTVDTNTTPAFSVATKTVTASNGTTTDADLGKFTINLDWKSYNYSEEYSGKDFWVTLYDGKTTKNHGKIHVVSTGENTLNPVWN